MKHYKRLTKRGKYGYVIEPYVQCVGDLKTVVDRLAKLENEIERGELLMTDEHLARCKEITDNMCKDCASNKDKQTAKVLEHCQQLINEACDKCAYKKQGKANKEKEKL